MLEIITSLMTYTSNPSKTLPPTSQRDGTTSYVMPQKSDCLALGDKLEAAELKWKQVDQNTGICYVTIYRF